MMTFSARWVALATASLCGVSAVCAQVEIADPPPEHAFGRVPVGATYATQYFSLTNKGAAPVTLGQVGIDAEVGVCAALGCPTVAAAGEFVVLAHSDGCSGTTLAPGAGCSTLLSFIPQTAGTKVARAVFAVAGAAPLTRVLSGTGVSNPTDCVLDWAERSFPQLLTGGTSTLVAGPFLARCYQGGALCVGADTALPTFAPPSVYLYQGGQLSRYAALSEVAASAVYPPPSSRRCDQSPDSQ